jgi:predicted N-formylglutamate amidohydrolase
VADLNRFEYDEECVPPVADCTEIPMNRALTPQERQQRLERYFFPAHAAIDRLIDEVAAEHDEQPFVFRIHSFSRTLRSKPAEHKPQDICVYNYPEFGRDEVFKKFINALRRRNPSLHVGNNEPFSARTPSSPDKGGSASPVSYRHLVQRHNPRTVALEVRQDLITTQHEQAHYADIIATALSEAFGFQVYNAAHNNT